MHPMIRALGRHRVPVSLIVFEVALAFTLVINVLNLVSEYAGHIAVQTGIDAGATSWLSSSPGSGSARNVSQEADIAVLRGAPKIENAALVSALPLSGTSAYSFKVSPDMQGAGPVKASANMYFWTRGALDTLGVRLASGRDFLPSEYVEYSFFGNTPPPAAILITRALAMRLFGSDDVVGKRVKLELAENHSAIVVGVVSRLISPSIHYQPDDNFSVIFPVLHVDGGLYVIRNRPGDGEGALAAARTALYRTSPFRIITRSETFKTTEQKYFQGDRSLIWTLCILASCLVLLTVAGIVSISNYWVVQRQRSIGIRRALGASRFEIIKYFLMENLALVLVGSILGLVGAVGLNILLMRWFEVGQLSLARPLVGLIAFVIVGQIAVLFPAIRASYIRPNIISGSD